jgi:hypothetical protein
MIHRVGNESQGEAISAEVGARAFLFFALSYSRARSHKRAQKRKEKMRATKSESPSAKENKREFALFPFFAE